MDVLQTWSDGVEDARDYRAIAQVPVNYGPYIPPSAAGAGRQNNARAALAGFG